MLKFLVAGVLVLGLLVSGVAGTVVMAQGPTPTTAPAGKLAQLFWQALANKLGITVETLRQDFNAARQDAINQGVKQGLITQAQADKMQQRLNQALGKNPPGLGLFKRGAQQGAKRGLTVGLIRGFFGPEALEAAATALNMKPAEVTAALRSGKTLADLAKQQNVDQAKLKAAIVNAEKAAVDRAVQDGLMTPAQADNLKSKLDQNQIDLTRPLFRSGPLGK